MILFILFSNVWASGENEEDYIKFGSISDDKRVVIKAHTLIVKQMNRIHQSFNNDADASYDQHLAIYNYESEKIHKSEPMIWESDAQFQQRKTEELEFLLEKINSEFESSIDAISKPYEEEFEMFFDEFEKNITQLQKKQSIEISGDAIDFDTYLRNDRLWPISLRLSNTYIPESTINVVVDFIGNNRTEPEIRSSIIEFDQARKDNQLSATLNYHIVPDYKFNANIQVIRYLVVIDSINLLHNTKNIRYTRTLDVPVLLHSISLDEELNLVDSQKDKRIGISNLKHSSFDNEWKELRSIQKPILLWSSSNNITDIQEKNRLSDLYT